MNQVPEWASSYINYKGLKKLIKNAAEASKNGSDPDLTGEYSFVKYPNNLQDALVVTHDTQEHCAAHAGVK
jgi:glycerophosphodiester phosphodiesterase